MSNQNIQELITSYYFTNVQPRCLACWFQYCKGCFSIDRVVRGVDARRTAGVDEGRPTPPTLPKPQPAPWVAPCTTVAVVGERLPAMWNWEMEHGKTMGKP